MREFKITPKRIKRTNGLVLTPEIEVVVSTNSLDLFSNCAKDMQEPYMRQYGFDYKKACCSRGDFDCKPLG